MNVIRWFFDAPRWVTWCSHFVIGFSIGLASGIWWLPVALYAFREASDVLYWGLSANWLDHLMDVATPAAASFILWSMQ